MGRAEVNVHGWVYKFESGQVFAYDPDLGQFESIAERPLKAHEVSEAMRAI
jgi:carbonic anhydrase